MRETSENLPKTGYTKDTANSYILNAGALVKNLEWDATGKKWTYERLGATSGGNKLTAKNTLRQVPVDGVFVPAVGQDMIESGELKLEAQLIEQTLENVKMSLFADAEAIATGDKDYPEGYTKITPREKIQKSDYISNLAYIGTLNGSDMPIIVIFRNAICTSGLEFDFQDKQEATVPVIFEGRADADDVDNQALPVTILYPTPNNPGGAVKANAQIDGVEKAEEKKGGRN